MNGTDSFAKALTDVMELWREGNIDRALKRVEELRKAWPGNAHVLVLSSRFIQLQDEPSQTLNEAKRLLQRAIELDKNSPEASIELGYFLDNVENDSHAAAKAFLQGISAARQLLIEGLLGQAHVVLQTNHREDAVRCLVEAFHLADAVEPQLKKKYTEQIDELLRELGQMQTA